MPAYADAWMFSNVEIDGALTGCRVSGSVICEVGADVVAQPGDRVVDGRAGALLVGLADHHVHVWAQAAVRESIDLGGARDLEDARGHPGGDGWLRIVGAGRVYGRGELDQAWPDRPVRLQHRSGAMWMLNSAAIDQLGDSLDAAERESGQLWRADSRLRAAIVAIGATTKPDVSRVGADLARLGVTHLSDATPDLSPASYAALAEALPQHLISLSAAMPGAAPAKLVISDHEPIDFDVTVAQIGEWHDGGRPVALHAVTRVALAVAIALLRKAGPTVGDRIEHAAVCDDAAADQLAELEVSVVTQPGLWTRRGLDFLAESVPEERGLLWRCGGLIRRGVRVALSSDAPFGPPDPWQTIRAAATRILADGRVGGAEECLSPVAALHSLLADPLDPTGPPRRITPGAPADLILLDGSLHASLASVVDSGRNPVRLTLIDGLAYT